MAPETRIPRAAARRTSAVPSQVGKPYRWAQGQSISEVNSRVAARDCRSPRACVLSPHRRECRWLARPLKTNISGSTAAFLSGKYADGPGWNERLFRAGCDLSARGRFSGGSDTPSLGRCSSLGRTRRRRRCGQSNRPMPIPAGPAQCDGQKSAQDLKMDRSVRGDENGHFYVRASGIAADFPRKIAVLSHHKIPPTPQGVVGGGAATAPHPPFIN